MNRITIDARSPSAFSTVNPGVFKASEYILWYAKDKNAFISESRRIPSERDKAYNKFIPNRDDIETHWTFKSLKMAFLEHLNEDKLEYLNEFLMTAYDDLQGKPRREIGNYLADNFRYHQLIKIKQISNYDSTAKISNFSLTTPVI
ncbi:MAG: hypothetical protein SCM88_14475 [Bacillota bacterium]|nr:hypothetical protein [Bacillota bacterium]